VRQVWILTAIAALGCAGEPAPAPRHPAEEDPAADAAGSADPVASDRGSDDPEAALAPEEPYDGAEAEAHALAPDVPFVLTAGGCTIRVGPIASFEISRGGYRSAEWIPNLPPAEAEMAESEDHFEAHGRCVLEVEVAGVRRHYLQVVSGFVIGGPEPSREECLESREQVARHLLVMTERCRDPDAQGHLAVP
jgi:hypothetical protein